MSSSNREHLRGTPQPEETKLRDHFNRSVLTHGSARGRDLGGCVRTTAGLAAYARAHHTARPHRARRGAATPPVPVTQPTATPLQDGQEPSEPEITRPNAQGG